MRFFTTLALLVLAACGSSVPSPATTSPTSPSAVPAPPVASSAPSASASAVPSPSDSPPAVPAPPTDVADQPLPEAARAALAAIRADPPPRAITRGKHYLVSDEHEQYLFRDAIDGRGGLLFGVGADQMYLLAGWARPEVVICMDFDQWIVDLHSIYGIVFRAEDSPEAFIKAWSTKRRAQTRALIEAAVPAGATREQLLKVFASAAELVHTQLVRIAARQKKRGISSFLDDGSQYARVRKLWQNGRVLAVRGDLTQSQTVLDIAEFSRTTRTPLRVAYLSNAEGYFDYGVGNFRKNMLALPFDEQGVLLHTKPFSGTGYRYIFQSGRNYQTWLGSGRAEKLCELFDFATPVARSDGEADLYTVALGPTEIEDPKRRCAKF